MRSLARILIVSSLLCVMVWLVACDYPGERVVEPKGNMGGVRCIHYPEINYSLMYIDAGYEGYGTFFEGDVCRGLQ